MNQDLLENQLSFLSSHRGTVGRAGESFLIDSERPEFTYAILGRDVKPGALPQGYSTLQRLPWSGVSADELAGAGFRDVDGVSYMVLGSGASAGETAPTVRIEVVDSAAALDVFSEVQARGFNESEESFRHWHPWLRQANHRNLRNPDQRFYIGHVDGVAAGATLVVHTPGVAGIYAVATLARFRKMGVSTSLLRAAISDARARGARTFTLQTKLDSYAESFYRRLGFERVFEARLFRR
jgi:GNAT superfamily N-acetyltransferase